MGILQGQAEQRDDEQARFNRRWRFLGGDTAASATTPSKSRPFQSQVAILGWGYAGAARQLGIARAVSIAGGDSWVGIPCAANWLAMYSPVSIAGGDSWVGIPSTPGTASGNTATFQSQVAILGWGYIGTINEDGAGFLVSIAGGDSWVGIPKRAAIPGRPLIAVSIAGGDSWVGIRPSNSPRRCFIQFQSQVAILGWGYAAR